MRREELDLLEVERSLEEREGRELFGPRTVVAFEEAGDRVLRRGPASHQAQAGSQEIAIAPKLGIEHVGLRDEVGPKELCESEGIDGVGLHLRLADRLELPRMGELQLDVVRRE